MEKKNFNEVLKAREAAEAGRLSGQDAGEPMHLDDTQRVKVLSPGRLVFKRFMRNKLAIAGSCILIFMFLFSFAGPLFYAHGQTDIFYKYDYLSVDYASATRRTDYTSYNLDDTLSVDSSVSAKANPLIAQMEEAGQPMRLVTGDDGVDYLIEKLGEQVYTIGSADTQVAAIKGVSVAVGTYNKMLGHMSYSGDALGDAFVTALDSAISAGSETFTFDGSEYTVTASSVKNSYDVIRGAGDSLSYPNGEPGAGFEDAFEARENGVFEFGGVTYLAAESGEGTIVYALLSSRPALVCSTFVFDLYQSGASLSSELKAKALMAMYGSGSFSDAGRDYSVVLEDDTYYLYEAGEAEPAALLSDFAVRRYSGEDSLSIEFKAAAQNAIEEMEDEGRQTASFVFALPELDQNGSVVVDENGETICVDTEINVTKKVGQYVLNCEQLTYLIDIYGPVSSSHPFGTDADGMDVLARMMYGGRISLMVGFVVVILECLLGVILGGIAGYFGGWVDTIIMRLVDVFYCIPSMPILIILGAFFDSMRLSSYMRLVWMMAVLGFLGWAGVARLVRGQILSLREQEFMTAAEATGISTSRRIFRHLIPNVMPQLIVNATMGLGSVIITESTLSFLGLGVKHPLATWGTMINSITSSNENLIRYAHIWIPVGCLICLTVIAFNFVGDGLRDAFDPKMKQ